MGAGDETCTRKEEACGRGSAREERGGRREGGVGMKVDEEGGGRSATIPGEGGKREERDRAETVGEIRRVGEADQEGGREKEEYDGG